MKHAGRAHSKFAASASERWEACPGSVELSEGIPEKFSPYALEGEQAHELLEALLKMGIIGMDLRYFEFSDRTKPTPEMWRCGRAARDFILAKAVEHSGSEILVETRIHLPFIHPEMFGTFDGAVIEHFGVLHVFDYKYGAGVPVSATKNLQMIFYGIGLAYRYHWNFKTVRHWIIQPRIRGYDGPTFWDESMKNVKDIWVPRFERAVERVLKEPKTYAEGSHCHWCKAKSICPLKTEGKLDKARKVFGVPA